MDQAPASAGGSRRRVDWSLAAHLLGQGQSATEVARQVGCAPTTIVRRLRKDQAFRRQIDPAPRRQPPARDRLQALRTKLHDAIESEVQGGNVRVILWLADRMKLIEPPATATPQDGLDQLIDDMSAEELAQFEQLRDPV